VIQGSLKTEVFSFYGSDAPSYCPTNSLKALKAQTIVKMAVILNNFYYTYAFTDS